MTLRLCFESICVVFVSFCRENLYKNTYPPPADWFRPRGWCRLGPTAAPQLAARAAPQPVRGELIMRDEAIALDLLQQYSIINIA